LNYYMAFCTFSKWSVYVLTARRGKTLRTEIIGKACQCRCRSACLTTQLRQARQFEMYEGQGGQGWREKVYKWYELQQCRQKTKSPAGGTVRCQQLLQFRLVGMFTQCVIAKQALIQIRRRQQRYQQADADEPQGKSDG